jgi:hypothetical protein
MFAVVSCTKCFFTKCYSRRLSVYPSIPWLMPWIWTCPEHHPIMTQSTPRLRHICRPESLSTADQGPNQGTYRSFQSLDQLAAEFKRLAPKRNAWNKLNLLLGYWTKKNLSCVEMILDWKLNVALKPSFHHWTGISKLAHVWLPKCKSIDYPLIYHYYPNSIPMNLRLSVDPQKIQVINIWGS